MSLPSKLTSYFTAGRAVIAAVPPEGATADEVKRSRAGIVVQPGQPESLAAAALELSRQPELRATLGSNGRDYALRALGTDAAHARALRFVSKLMGREQDLEHRAPNGTHTRPEVTVPAAVLAPLMHSPSLIE